MIRALIFLSLYASFWGASPTYGWILQIAYLPLLFTAGVYAFVNKRVRPDPPSVAEVVLFSAALLSTAVTMFRGMYELTEYSIVFFIALTLLSITARSVSLEDLLATAATAAFFGVITCLIVERQALVVALSVHYDRNGLTRFGPLGTNPDVVGLIFASSAILMMHRALVTSRRTERAVMLAGMILALIFVVAASARASFLAFFAACIVAFGFEIRFKRSTYQKIAVVSVLLLPLVLPRLYKYLGGIFELSSRYRGVGSGGSGRTMVWAKGLAAIFSDPIRLCFGGGIRSSEKTYIGFFTEDSYITVLLDSGLFLGTAIICIYPYAALKALQTTQQPGNPKSLILVCAYIVFVLCESVFNRYLLAIGNPCSLVTILILISIAVRRQPAADPAGEFGSIERTVG